MVLAMLFGMLGIQPAKPVLAATTLRVSQVYGGGGNTGAPFTHDFVEIFNSGSAAVSLNGLSVQYASAAGTGNFGSSAGQITVLPDVMLAAGQYYLIQEGSGANGVPLPIPDLIDDTPIAMGTASGKIALVNSQVSLGCNGSSTICTPEQLALIVDLVGYGEANFYEGAAAAPVLSNTTAALRNEGGCQDTDDNAADFQALTPTPRNTASPTNSCTPVGPIPPVINEFSANTTGTDVEFVEFFGTPNTDYSAYTLLEIEGDANTTNSSEGFVDEVVPLGTTDANGLLLVNLAANALENGTISLLLVKDNTATLGVDIDTDDDGVIDLTYWSEITDGVAINDGGAGDLTYAIPVLVSGYDGIAFTPGGASRIPDGTDTDTSADWVRNDFDLAGIPGFLGTIATGEAYNTPGTSNQVYVETAPSVVSTIPANGGNHPMDENITVTFSEAVTVTDPWYSIVCATSGTHTAVVTDADPVYTLNPDVNFTVGESCTVTITAANVVDDDTDDATFDAMLADYTFTFTAITPPERCGDPFTPTYQIQGNGETSPLAGTVLATEGVVVGDFQVGGKNGYYIQDPTGDGDTATSDGIFVYNTATAVNVGDHVRVRGTAVEYYGITEISPVTQVWICSTGNTVVPTAVTLPVTAVSDFEKYESMLVTFTQSLIISEYFNFDRYGEIVLTSTRHMTPTALVEPGAPAQAEAAAYLLDRITLDDGRTSQNPDPAIHPNGLTFNMTNLFRGGGTVTNVTGILDYYQSLYRVQPTTGAVYADANPRTAAPEITEADLKVTSFNVLNYFVTLDDGVNDICGPDGIQECRGADNADEFARQKAKILAALDIIDSDIYGLMEIENDSPISQNDAVADLVAGLNAIKGEGTYAYIDTGAIGGDAIKQAILYKPAAVTPVGGYQILDSSVDARFIDTANRPVLAQVFMDNETGEEFVVAVNHLKSKGSACVDDPDLGDGQGNCNLTRLAAAEALVDWLANPMYFGDIEKTLIIGDLNSYDKEDPIDAIKLGADDTADTADDYLDMIFEKRGELAYGYVYDGQTGYLDHALANQAMAESIGDVNTWHINADEPDLIDYDTSFKLPAQDLLYAPDAYRSSDHDPVIVTMSFVPFSVTNVDLMQSTDPLTLETTATPLPGSLTGGFTMVLDPAVPWYYFDTDTIASNRPLADGSYPFYLEGTTNEIFTLVVNGTDYFLRDTYANDDTPLRVQGNFPLGAYTYVGDVTDTYGLTDEVSLTITFVAPLAVTEVDLEASTVIAGPYEALPGNLADGFTMVLDPAVPWYYFDTDTITSNRPLADGSYPFYLEGTTTELFTLVVNGTDYFLRDTYANDGTPLRVQGNFPLGAYTYVGDVEDTFGFIDEVSLTITFVAPLAVTEVSLVQSIDLSTWTPVEGNLADGYAMNLDITVEYYYLDAESVTSNRTLADGSYPFYMTANPGAEFFAYWAERGVVDGATGWQALMWQIINGNAPMFYLKVEGATFTLIDGLQGEPNPLRVNGGYYPGLYAFSGVVEDEFGFEDELDVDIFFNDIPFAEDQAVTTPEETAIDITLVATDIEGEALTYAIVAEPTHGTVTLVGNIATYTPALDFVGEDSFTFKANDGIVDSNIANITITVTPVNDPPVAVDDAYEVDEDDVLTVAAPGVMANDIEVDTDNMVVVLVSNVSHGSLVLLGDGSFTYTPDPDFTGTDSFVYKLITYPAIEDAWTDEATVTITVNPINDAPVAEDQNVTTAEDTAKDINLVATDIDGDELTYAIVDEPSHGGVVLEGSVATYTPDPDFNGEDSFTFTATDGTLISDMAVVTITVTPVNDAPVAVDDGYTTNEDEVLTVFVAEGLLANDSDVDGDTITVDSYTVAPQHGTIILNADGSFTYTPDDNFFGTDSFVYKIIDGNPFSSDEATVTITVTPVNDWVVANDDEYETMAGVLLIVAAPGILENDVLLDPDEEVTIQILEATYNGSLGMNSDGSFTYMPDAGFFGVDTFEYQLNSTTMLQGEFSDTAIVTIKVTAMQIFLPLILR
jgi:VCBS repeat-containing protein